MNPLRRTLRVSLSGGGEEKVGVLHVRERISRVGCKVVIQDAENILGQATNGNV